MQENDIFHVSMPLQFLFHLGWPGHCGWVMLSEEKDGPRHYQTARIFISQEEQPAKVAKQIGLRDVAPPLAIAMFHLAQQHCSVQMWSNAGD